MYVQIYTLYLPDVFENFRNMWLEIYELGPACCLTATALALPAASKKTKVKLMLLMVEKGIRGGICYAINQCAKSNNKYMKGYDKKRIVIF